MSMWAGHVVDQGTEMELASQTIDIFTAHNLVAFFLCRGSISDETSTQNYFSFHHESSKQSVAG